MSFSTVFKDLRRKCELTQEDVASALSVTPQAVSRWECGSAMPDITLIPKISRMFGVTADYLLEIDITRTEEEVGNIIESAAIPYNHGNMGDVVRIYRAGLSRFPNHHKLMHHLASALSGLSSQQTDPEKRRTLLAEVCGLCDRILAASTDSEIRHAAVQTYIYALSDMARNGFDPGAAEKARAIAMTMPEKILCREELLMGLADFEEAFAIRRKNAFDFFYHDLPFFILWAAKSDIYTDEEILALCETAEKLCETVFPDDNPFCRSWNSNFIPEIASGLYLKKGDTENALRCIRKLAEEAVLWDKNRFSPDREAGSFTIHSLMFRGITEKKGWIMTNGSGSMTERIHHLLTGEPYESLRENAAYQKILQSLHIAAEQYRC